MSNQQIAIDYDTATRSISEISRLISNIASATTQFRAEIEQAYDNSDLTFLKNVANAMGPIESAAKQLKNSFIEIEEALNAYIRQFDEYDQDSSGI